MTAVIAMTAAIIVVMAAAAAVAAIIVTYYSYDNCGNYCSYVSQLLQLL